MDMPVLDAETKAAERPDDHKDELRLWLRLLACANLIEAEIRRRLRAEFGVTLPRFDLLAQLDKTPRGLTLGAVSRRMMVSNGNVTGLVSRLVTQGLLERARDGADRRVTLIRLTADGRRAFARMARAHEDWIAELFGGLAAPEQHALMDLLARAKRSVTRVAA